MIRNVTKSAKKSDPKIDMILCNSEDNMMIFATDFVDQFFPFVLLSFQDPCFSYDPPKKTLSFSKNMLITQLKCKKIQCTFSL
jgi:hypothetical protein